MRYLNHNKSSRSLTGFLLLLLSFGFSGEAFGQMEKSAPVNRSEFKKTNKKFEKRYRLKAGEIEQTPIRIEIDDTLKMLLTSQTDPTGKGLVFHYLIDAIANETCYAISAGIQAANNHFTPKEFDANENGIPYPHYFIIKNNGDLERNEVKDSLNLISQYEIYRKNVDRRSWTFFWRDTENMKDHPRMIFHNGNELNAFIQQWKDDKPNDTLYLYIYNGMDKTPDGKLFFKVRNYSVPVLRIGNETVPFPIDDEENTEELSGDGESKLKIKYRAKAFDAGHVCPPHCIRSTYSD